MAIKRAACHITKQKKKCCLLRPKVIEFIIHIQNWPWYIVIYCCYEGTIVFAKKSYFLAVFSGLQTETAVSALFFFGSF